VLGVRPDQLDHQVEFTGAVGVARLTLRLIRRDELGCVDAVQTVNALGVAVCIKNTAHVRKPVRENSTSWRKLDGSASTTVAPS